MEVRAQSDFAAGGGALVKGSSDHHSPGTAFSRRVRFSGHGAPCSIQRPMAATCLADSGSDWRGIIGLGAGVILPRGLLSVGTGAIAGPPRPPPRAARPGARGGPAGLFAGLSARRALRPPPSPP